METKTTSTMSVTWTKRPCRRLYYCSSTENEVNDPCMKSNVAYPVEGRRKIWRDRYHTTDVSMSRPLLAAVPESLVSFDRLSLDFLRGACGGGAIWNVVELCLCTVMDSDRTSSWMADSTVTTVDNAFWFSDITRRMWSISSRVFSSLFVLLCTCCNRTSSSFSDRCMASS